VISRVLGAAVRAVLVMILIMTPALLLSVGSADANQIVVLIALVAGMFTFAEYASSMPSLVEFRFAAPFNRTRFISLWVVLFCVSHVASAHMFPTTMSLFVRALGDVVGQILDFRYSPVWMFLDALPDTLSEQNVRIARAGAGLSYFVTLIALVCFAGSMQIARWPGRSAQFNMWVNLPTFDPTTSDDVARRMVRDSWANIILGIVFPFISPSVFVLVQGLISEGAGTSSQTMVWAIAAWSFIPLSLMMRGLALARLAHMLRVKREKVSLASPRETWQLA